MQIKRFLAESVEAALADVKREFGPDAWILSNKRLRPAVGRFGRSARPVVEVVAAAESAFPHPGDEDGGSQSLGHGQGEATPPALTLSKHLFPLQRELRALRDAFEDEHQRDDARHLRDEVESLRTAIRDLERRLCDGEDSAAVLRLCRRGFSNTLSRALVQEEEPGGETQGDDAERRLRSILRTRLDRALAPPQPGADPPIELFVGAPGVGKTTSLAKIAGRDREHCALLCTDTDRAGGSEALGHFASEAGIPFALSWGPDAILSRGLRLGRARLLIDTPGTSDRDPERRRALQELREQCGDRIQVHWVASATTRDAELRAELRRFESLRPDTMILTQADATTSLAPLADLILDPATPPLRWIGTGTRVPGDLALPDPGRLSRRLLADSR